MKQQVKEIISSHLKSVDNPVVFECGVGFGDNTRHLLEYVKDREYLYLGFEADPNNIKRIEESDLISKIYLFPYAVDQKSGESKFYISNTGTSSSLLKPRRHLYIFPHVTFSESVDVQTASIDDICEEYDIKKIDLVYLNTQGNELNVMRGGHLSSYIIDLVVTSIYDEQDELYEGCCSQKEFLAYMSLTHEVILQDGATLVLKRRK